ncbi:MAG: ATP-dependent Clp protease ATP-binding subunit ClpC, partial [Clostridia bacterium]|nr:ATP-dependent Clp protease ATP-binding subunit ClpC [Clostridia bacterium]
MNLAIQAAAELGHTYIGTEHVVLGLLREGTGVAASVLAENGITAAEYQEKIIEVEGSGQQSRLTPQDFTPRVKTSMELAVAEAGAMQQGFVGTEHILLAVLQDESSVAVRLLVALGARPEELGEGVTRAIGMAPPQTVAESGRGGGR